ncbi:MAG TPA: DUF3311 domain-containing protein [Streptosporangiaceae bacterium]|jgi:hypothetical protein
MLATPCPIRPPPEDAVDQPARSARHTGVWVTVAVLLIIAVVGTVWVPIYARATPALGGFPFFYWYQLLWIPLVAIVTSIAYLLARRAGRDTSTGGQDGAR